MVPAKAENMIFLAIGVSKFVKSLYDLFLRLKIVVQTKLVASPPHKITTNVTLFEYK